MTRRLLRRETDIDPTTEVIPETTPTVEEIPDITPSSDSESEEDKMPDHIPRRHKYRSPHVNRGVRRSQRIAGRQPQYMGIFCQMEGEGDVLYVDSVLNVVHRNEYFLASVDLNEYIELSFPADNFLDRDSYVTSDGTIEEIHPYAFSAKEDAQLR